VWGRHDDVVVGVVDVGSNTVRLLVTRGDRTVITEREMLHLGADVERLGRISPEKLALVAELVGTYAADARAAGASRLEVLITSPGRQAGNGEALLDRLRGAAAAPARILSAAEEGRLAFVGAMQAAAPPARRLVGVVDVGGGSAQVVIGTRRDGPLWSRSIDIGAQRLTSRMLSADPPGRPAVEAARAEVARYLEDFAPPAPRTAFAVGGSARALRRIVGARLGTDELERALGLLAETPATELSERFGLRVERAETLAAGCVVLAALERVVEAPLRVVRGGLREGALLELAAETLAA
jgi:exopolyphosphatase / guanosine-5'-triphosphate,3'-diphosphate pyrophosphatase